MHHGSRSIQDRLAWQRDNARLAWLLVILAAACIIVPVCGAHETFSPIEWPFMQPTGLLDPPSRLLDQFTSSDPNGATMGDIAWAQYVRWTIRDWIIPFWNPFQGIGEPFLAEGGTGVLYPLSSRGPRFAWPGLA